MALYRHAGISFNMPLMDTSQHSHRRAAGNSLLWSLVVTVGFAVIEVVGGLWSSSLALLGDAGHMVTDSTALGLAAFAAWVGQQPPSARHSYGLVRAEVLAAMLNGLFMLLIVIGIAYFAFVRLSNPHPVQGGTVMVIAAIGLVVNLVVAMILHRGEKTLNTRAALLHVMGDLLGSVAALCSGMIIYFTGWMPIDPLLSLVICVLILYASLRLLREVLHVIMEGVPRYLDLPEVGQAMAGVANVKSIHDLHIWTLSSGMVALSAHVVLSDMAQWHEILGTLRNLLHNRYAIDHITLQPELDHQLVQPLINIRE
jgi:cobalt-zinc-cadmium efflux system protein